MTCIIGHRNLPYKANLKSLTFVTVKCLYFATVSHFFFPDQRSYFLYLNYPETVFGPELESRGGFTIFP